MAGYSYLTGHATTSPPGRAVAVYQHGFGVEFMDFPQAVVVGADADAYRRLNTAERRARFDTQDDPAPMLLSPDGTHVAVGDWYPDEPDLAILDLRTGEVDVHPVPGGHAVLPLAWSPDSSLVSYLSTTEPAYPHSGRAVTGDLGLLEPGTGEARLLGGVTDAREASFSPDGTELAVHRIDPDDGLGSMGTPQIGGGAVDVVDLDGQVRRQIELPADQYLDGPNAWSPDGTLLATGQMLSGCLDLAVEGDQDWWSRCVTDREAVFFHDASGDGAPVPAPLTVEVAGGHGVLGWTGEDEVLVLDDVSDPADEGATSELHWLTAVPLDGDDPRPLSAMPGGGNYGIGNVQLAAALLPDLQVREAGPVDRGRWPTPLSIVAALGAAAAALVATSAAVRRRARPPTRMP